MKSKIFGRIYPDGMEAVSYMDLVSPGTGGKRNNTGQVMPSGTGPRLKIHRQEVICVIPAQPALIIV
ncbi:MAG: hypothetical protein M9904_17655 [Chitinophagaceae bacterium]|nr:hypothetical protein [Chitinophagaceae bacterium]